MMISPEGYYEEHLRGTSQRKRWKTDYDGYSWPEAGNGPTEKIMENPDYGSETSLMALFVEHISTLSADITSFIKSKVTEWMLSQASFIQALFGNICCESWVNIKKELDFLADGEYEFYMKKYQISKEII